MIKFQKWITRQDLRNNTDMTYVFDDNVYRKGLGGQAKEMRGEANAFGIVTKRSPGMEDSDFFSDESKDDWKVLLDDLDKLGELEESGRILVFPSDGLGTGLSQLPKRATKLYERLYETVTEMNDGWEIPWEKPHVH